MDPLTHGLLGACAAELALATPACRQAGRADLPLVGAGFLAAMTPDLDILLRSARDPLSLWMIHRQFSHSLIFVPVGGLIVALILWFFYRRRYGFAWVYLAATAGFATHGLLDACTSYGTLLYWPFSQYRVAWDILPIVDPIFTFILLLGFLGSLWRRSTVPACLALLTVGVFIGIAIHQHQRGLQAQGVLVESRSQVLSRGRVMPTIGNILVWRSLYESNGVLYADALRLPLWGETVVWQGTWRKKFRREDFSVPVGTKLDKDLNEFQWFADDYLVLSETEVIGDVRFASRTGGLDFFWGVRALWGQPEKGVQKVRLYLPWRDSLGELWQQVLRKSPGAQPISSFAVKPFGG